MTNGLAFAALALLTGCGGSNANEAESTTAITSVSQAPSTANVLALRAIRNDFRLNFDGTTWYTDPSKLQIERATLVARTHFYPDDAGQKLARDLCNALNGNYVLANTASYGLDGVAVYARGELLAAASSGGTC
jgi:hypothetical protein